MTKNAQKKEKVWVLLGDGKKLESCSVSSCFNGRAGGAKVKFSYLPTRLWGHSITTGEAYFCAPEERWALS